MENRHREEIVTLLDDLFVEAQKRMDRVSAIERSRLGISEPRKDENPKFATPGVGQTTESPEDGPE